MTTKICIASLNSLLFSKLAKLTSKKEYCDRYGYDLRVKTEGLDIHLGFLKIRYLTELIKENKYDWIWWLGADTLITNHRIKVEDVIDDNFHIIIAYDVYDYNSDSILVKSSKEALGYLEKVLSLYDQFVSQSWAEQAAMISLKPEYKDIIKVVPQRLINAYDYTLYGTPEHTRAKDANGNDGQWKPGDFVLHFPGLPLHFREEQVVRRLPEVIK